MDRLRWSWQVWRFTEQTCPPQLPPVFSKAVGWVYQSRRALPCQRSPHCQRSDSLSPLLHSDITAQCVRPLFRCQVELNGLEVKQLSCQTGHLLSLYTLTGHYEHRDERLLLSALRRNYQWHLLFRYYSFFLLNLNFSPRLCSFNHFVLQCSVIVLLKRNRSRRRVSLLRYNTTT